jgi:hypothetical protein
MESIGALMTGSFVALAGWLVPHFLELRKDRRNHQLQAQLTFVERQIEELYGPLAASLYEGRRTFRDLLESLGRDYVFSESDELPEGELSTWLYWAEADFLPRNEYIKTLLKSKAHLIDGAEFPDSYVEFLDHCNSWAISHKRWLEQQVEYNWHSKVDWPDAFENQVIATFQSLKRRHSDLLGELAVVPISNQ